MLNKTDLEMRVEKEELEPQGDGLHRDSGLSQGGTGDRGAGAGDQADVLTRNLSFNDEVYITSVRHKEALGKALESLQMVKNSVEQGLPEDFLFHRSDGCLRAAGGLDIRGGSGRRRGE